MVVAGVLRRVWVVLLVGLLALGTGWQLATWWAREVLGLSAGALALSEPCPPSGGMRSDPDYWEPGWE